VFIQDIKALAQLLAINLKAWKNPSFDVLQAIYGSKTLQLAL